MEVRRILGTVQLNTGVRKADNSIKYTFTTLLEGSTEDITQADELRGARGVLYFKEGDKISADEIDAVDQTDVELYDKPKTQAQRIRGVLFRVWEQAGSNGEFKDFYKTETERIIEHFKNKLE